MLGVYFTGGRKRLNLLRLKHILPGKDGNSSPPWELLAIDPFTSGGTSCRKNIKIGTSTKSSHFNMEMPFPHRYFLDIFGLGS